MKTVYSWAGAIVLMFGALTEPALACTCMAFPNDDSEAVSMAWPQADAVFFGRVTAVKAGLPGVSRWRQVTFDVSVVWKGVPDDVPIVVRTASSSAACGYAFKKGERYVVFASKNPKDGTLTTSLCALNKRERDAEGVMRELDKVKKAEAKTPWPASAAGSSQRMILRL